MAKDKKKASEIAEASEETKSTAECLSEDRQVVP